MLVLDDKLRVASASKSFFRLLATDSEKTLGHDLKTIGNGCLDVPQVKGLLDKLTTDAGAIENYELEAELPKLGRRKLIMNAVDIPQKGDSKRKILLAIDDVTDFGRDRPPRG